MSSALPTDEARLLLGAVRSGVRDAEAAVPVVDWAVVARIGQREKLLSVLWGHLSRAERDLPEGVEVALRRHAAVTEFRMLALEARLREVVRFLDDEGIPVLLLKGAALSLTVYRSFAQRPMCDLDLLVPNHQARDAWSALREAGWTREYENAGAFYDDHQHLCPLVSPGGTGAVVELHRHLVHRRSPFQLSEDAIWSEAVPVTVGGRTAYVLSPSHQVLHLSVHCAWSHMLGRGLLRTVRDLTALASARDLDWDSIVALSRDARAETCCYWTLRLARNLGGLHVPETVLDRLKPPGPSLILDGIERLVLAGALDVRGRFTPSIRVEKLIWERAIRPERSGHGASRPWTANEGWANVVNAPDPPGLGRRLFDQLRRLPRWLRFVQVVTDLRSGAAPGGRSHGLLH